jgi:hypothetical protein
MPNGTTAAVTEAARLDEIGFPEFTAKLITDTFDALVSANLRQTEAYIELVQSVAKSLKEFINDTHDDISGEELLRFLAAVLPPGDLTSDEPTKVKVGVTLTNDEYNKLNDALYLPDGALEAGNNTVATPDVPLDQAKVDTILEAVANRLAANRYDLLKEMVKQGILRLVVENGLIESRLTFTTYGSTFYQKNASDYHRDTYRNKSKGRTGGIVSLFGSYSSTTYRTSINIRTSKETHRDISGSQVQIFGMVRINFKTDYLPLPA